MSGGPTARLAEYRLQRGLAAPVARYLARPFPRRTRLRVAIFHHPAAISFSQVYPFLYYAPELRARFGAEIRCFAFDHLLQDTPRSWPDADVVLVQPWFTILPDDLIRAMDRLRDRWPDAALSFLDSFAHNDLRLARHLPADLAFYVKKSVFRDHSAYQRAYRGDTNLTEYYSDLYDLPAEPVDFSPPPGLADKLRPGANFFTAPRFIRQFRGDPPPQAGRELDIQTRLGQRGTGWYQAMRRAAVTATEAIPGITRSPEGAVSHAAYMDEMRLARLCFSPFGFGELCWRDIEAMQAGAVLIKPDMGHLQTLPDLYEPGVTYLPVKWDFSDLQEVVQTALADPALRDRIATTAYRRIGRYIDTGAFVDDMGFLFERA